MEFGKEKIYTIPVNDAFQEDSECPFCAMERKLEEDAIAFTLGPSYMEDDVDVYKRQNFCIRPTDLTASIVSAKTL